MEKGDRKLFHPMRKKLRIYRRPFHTEDERKMFSREIQFRKFLEMIYSIIVLFAPFIAHRAQILFIVF